MNIWTSCTLSSILALSLLAPSVSFANENPNLEAAFSKETASQYPMLKKAKKPEEAGFSSEKLEKVDQLIEMEVAAGFLVLP